MDRRLFLSGTVALGATAAASSGIGGSVGHALGRTRLDEVLDGTLDRRASGSVEVIYSVTTDKRLMALTFDDGPHPELTPRVLDVLADHGVPSTFFLLGANVREQPGLARRIVDAGHEVANHSFDHPKVTLTTADDVMTSILLGGKVISSTTDVVPTLYRPPRGEVTGAVIAGAAMAGQDVVLWSIGRGGPTIADDDTPGIVANIREQAHPGAIVCLHDGIGLLGEPESATLRVRRTAEIDGLSRLITTLRDDGWTLTTVSDMRRRAAN